MEWMIIITILGTVGADYTEKSAACFAKDVDHKSNTLFTTIVYKAWDYFTSLTDEAAKDYAAAQEAYFKYQEEIWPELMKFPWKDFKDPVLKRAFYLRSQRDEAALTVEKRRRLTELTTEMINIYSKKKIKEYGSNPSDPPTLDINDIANKFETESDDACKMAYYWDGWHTTVGRAVKSLFEEDIQLLNEMAILNNFTDSAARWQDEFETEDFEGVLAKLMNQIRPLFTQLHAYIRRKLWLSFGKNSKIIDRRGAIPASLLGNVYGLDASFFYDKTAPYPNLPSPDATPKLVSQNYTGEKMARAAEQFYLSINMSAMVDTFWKYSIFEKPKDRNISCSDEAYSFYNGKDYRLSRLCDKIASSDKIRNYVSGIMETTPIFKIRMCTRPTMEYFGRVHHEMGHTENTMIWKNLPFIFQDAPNPGLNEAIGDMVYIFSTNPIYLKELGLIDADFEITDEQEINVLYQKALEIVFFLPYAYNLDSWRWKVMQGKITPDNYNCEYWRLRLQDQGVEPPVFRDESGVDPGAKSHILNNYKYISYFVSGIFQFQLHRALCITAGEYSPDDPKSKSLYLCNIHNSKAAGNKLKKMLDLGRSHVWGDALEIVTGQREMSAEPLLEFFKPLYNWLVRENEKTNETIGWDIKPKACFKNGLPKSPINDSCRYNWST